MTEHPITFNRMSNCKYTCPNCGAKVVEAVLSDTDLETKLALAVETMQRAVDDEETGHWGPDITVKAYLEETLAKIRNELDDDAPQEDISWNGD